FSDEFGAAPVREILPRDVLQPIWPGGGRAPGVREVVPVAEGEAAADGGTGGRGDAGGAAGAWAALGPRRSGGRAAGIPGDAVCPDDGGRGDLSAGAVGAGNGAG